MTARCLFCGGPAGVGRRDCPPCLAAKRLQLDQVVKRAARALKPPRRRAAQQSAPARREEASDGEP